MKNILSYIVLFASGVDVEFLKEKSSGEVEKYYPIGLGVLVTTLLGFISMMFATHSIFKVNSFWDEIPLLLFSLFWGFAIFTIDWGLVKTMKKSANPTRKKRIALFFSILFRLSVAVIISYTISKPMEIKIYEKRLTAQIEKDRQAFVKREWGKKNEYINELEGSISSTMKSNTDIIKKQNDGPKTTSYKLNIDELKKCRSKLETLTNVNNKKINRLYSERLKIRNAEDSWESYYVLEDSVQVSKLRLTTKARNRIWRILNKLIPRLKSEIESHKTVCNEFVNKLTTEETSYKKSYNKLIENYSGQLDAQTSEKYQKKLEDSVSLAEIKKASFVSFNPDHPGLITQIESMSNFEKTPEGKSVSLVRLLLLLVIIAIDTAPIVIKLLTKRTTYDELKDAEKERLLFLSWQENNANRFLVRQLSTAQKEVLNEAILSWKKKEKENNKNNG